MVDCDDDSPDLAQELAMARGLALAAGAVLLCHRGRVDVERKGDDEPVTIADRESSDLIVDGLTRAFPDDLVISEEAPDDAEGRRCAQRLWLVDPLDGTSDYIRGDVGFAVMIGLAIAGRPRLGVVYQVAERRLYLAAPGVGAMVETPDGVTAARVSAVDALGGARLVASKSHRDAALERVRIALAIGDELSVGSVGVKMGLIARGERDVYVNPNGMTKLWDSCAPEAILGAAGGKVTDLWGERLRYDQLEVKNRRGMVASNGLLHAATLARLAPVVGSIDL